jgi:dimethylhistidine N-methyltransferase
MNVPPARLQTGVSLEQAGRGALVERYAAVRAETERLAALLSAEDQNVQSMADTSPTKWHRAHTTWFFETFVLSGQAGYKTFDDRYGFLFNSYYEAVGPRHARPERGILTRPGIGDIRRYREHVDAHMLALLEQRGDDTSVAYLTELGLQHEQQHQELILTDILHAFAQNPIRPAYAPYTAYTAAKPASAGTNGFKSFDGGIVEVGHGGGAFAFDNETPRHETLLHPFRLSDRLVTNGEWLEFMAAGGYEAPSHWLSDGWAFAREACWASPLYWQNLEGSWHAMTLSGLLPIDPDAPVAHISFYEADAFSRWRGKRMPTEFEWEHAAASGSARAGNFRESGFLRPMPHHTSGAGLFGDVWQWTQSLYMPYPGFRAAEGAVGEYNGKFMINQMVLRGGSCVTSADHIRSSYRNFFYPHQRWQFAGLRLAEDMPRHGRIAPHGLPPFLNDVWSGLSRSPKALPSKYFYDEAGSQLFESICELPEYYLTRSEAALLRIVARELADTVEPNITLVEFGCGACTKTRVLLDRLPNIANYVPIDICEDSLKRSIAPLLSMFPAVSIHPLAGDFVEEISLPLELTSTPRLGFFSGSTIGNFEIDDAVDFLRRARHTLGPDGKFLVAIDLAKDVNTLLSAYDDAQGVTARFNKNLLVRINRELGGDFALERFSHRAVWNSALSRIEMHLVSDEDQTVWVAGRAFVFAKGETIHTENSHKYTLDSFADIAGQAGWAIERTSTCPPPEFGLVLLR